MSTPTPSSATASEVEKAVERIKTTTTDDPYFWSLEYEQDTNTVLTALAAARKDGERLLNVARGCHDYNGGHYDAHDHETFHHGIQTVINALEAAAKRDPGDTQVNALEAMGRATRQLEVISWQVGTPVIGAGEMARYWCAVKGSAAEGRRLLCYGNAYIMPLSDSCHDAPANAVAVGDDGDYAWTGWFETSCEQCDTYWAFHGEVIRWFELPEATRQLEGKP